MSLSHLIIITIFSLIIIGATSLPSTTTVGINYRQLSNLYTPNEVPFIIESLKIKAVRLLQPDRALIRAFSFSNISILISVSNALVPSFAANRLEAELWLRVHVVPFYPRAQISIISVGSDFHFSPDNSDTLLSAIRNVHLALRNLGIQKIAVSTTFSFIDIMPTSFLPSNADFAEPSNDVVIKPLLQFLSDTNSSFLVNLFPYNIYKLNSPIPIAFPLFEEQSFNYRDDLITGVRYRNMFDMMVDAVIAAMAVSGHENIPLIVTETGWPSSGNDMDAGASKWYAEMYLKGLLSHLKSGLGTPLRKEKLREIYIYELFDNDTNTAAQQWGILYPNATEKYKIDFSGSEEIAGEGILGCILLIQLCLMLMIWSTWFYKVWIAV